MRLLALAGALCCALFATPSQAQSAQEFWVQEAQRAAGPQKRVRQGRTARTPRARQTISPSLYVGGSWLQANIGAGRPRGAPGAWCGYAMRLEMVSLGRGDPGPAYNLAINWARYGSPAPAGAVGSIMVSCCHVSRVVAGSCPPGRVATISGNAGRGRVDHMCEPLGRAVAFRWP